MFYFPALQHICRHFTQDQEHAIVHEPVKYPHLVRATHTVQFNFVTTCQNQQQIYCKVKELKRNNKTQYFSVLRVTRKEIILKGDLLSVTQKAEKKRDFK